MINTNEKILNSKDITEKYYNIIKKRLKNKDVKLEIILIGDREDSTVYTNIKKKKCDELGITCIINKYNVNTDEETIINKINEFNNDNSVTGIMIQLPLPKNLDKNKIISNINVKKDIDGLHSSNLGKLMTNDEPFFYPRRFNCIYN